MIKLQFGTVGEIRTKLQTLNTFKKFSTFRHWYTNYEYLYKNESKTQPYNETVKQVCKLFNEVYPEYNGRVTKKWLETKSY